MGSSLSLTRSHLLPTPSPACGQHRLLDDEARTGIRVVGCREGLAGDSASFRRPAEGTMRQGQAPRPGALPREKLRQSLNHGGSFWLGKGKPARPPTAESELLVLFVPAAGGGQQQLGHVWLCQHLHLQPWLGAGMAERPPTCCCLQDLRSAFPAPYPSTEPRCLPVAQAACPRQHGPHLGVSAFSLSGSKQSPALHP